MQALQIWRACIILFINLTGNKQKIAANDLRLEDRVADSLAQHEITGSESLLIGRNFGSVIDIETGPNGNFRVVSLTYGAMYEALARQARQISLGFD